MKVVLGLGNPGKEYERTRHNLGFQVVDEIASRHGVPLGSKPSLHAVIGGWRHSAQEVLLVKPQTYMNRSGQAAHAVMQQAGTQLEDLVVVHDDLDLPFGRIRIRARGSAAGHRGVQSVLDALGAEGFLRVRIGIGRPRPGLDVTDYVLEPFSTEQSASLGSVISRAAEAVVCLVQDGAKAAMERFNRLDQNGTGAGI